jgi:hypothetical protein
VRARGLNKLQFFFEDDSEHSWKATRYGNKSHYYSSTSDEALCSSEKAPRANDERLQDEEWFHKLKPRNARIKRCRVCKRMVRTRQAYSSKLVVEISLDRGDKVIGIEEECGIDKGHIEYLLHNRNIKVWSK